jgi:hypothetical protein
MNLKNKRLRLDRSYDRKTDSRSPEQRKKKEPKKKESCGRGSLWKLSPPRKSIKVAFGYIFLMISSAAWKTLLGFPQLPQTRRRLHPLQINWRRQSLDSVTFLGEAIRGEF